MTRPPAQFTRSFFLGFEPGRFLIKSTGLFLLLLGGGTTLADWSLMLNELRTAVGTEKYGIFLIYALWEILFFGYELIRLKLRYDLAHARWLNRQARINRRRRP